jgi:hypothetical protein
VDADDWGLWVFAAGLSRLVPSVVGWILGFGMASAREISLRDRGGADLTVVEAPVVGLRPHERNPRSITKQRLEALKADLEADLEADPEMLRRGR